MRFRYGVYLGGIFELVRAASHLPGQETDLSTPLNEKELFTRTLM